MKICYIATKSIHTRRWVEYFAEKGHDVHLITPEYDDIKGVKVHEVNPKVSKLSPLFKAIIIRNLVRKIKPDILHAHQVVPFGLYGALSRFHPFVVSPWGSDIAVFPEKSGIHRSLVKYVLKKADVISAVNRIIKSRLMELKCSKDKIVPLQVASVDTDKFHPSKKSKSLIKAIDAENDFLVVSARWFKPIYHVDVFIRAIPYVLERLSNAKFIIIGGGYLEDKLKDLSKQLKIEKNILFVGKVCHEDMTKYLASADLYVDTFVSVSAMWDESSIDETCGIGTTSLEAMSCGVPVLIANKNRIDKYPYRTYRPLDHADLAEQIVKLLKNKELRKQMKKDARDFAIRNGDTTTAMKKWEKFYLDFNNKY